MDTLQHLTGATLPAVTLLLPPTPRVTPDQHTVVFMLWLTRNSLIPFPAYQHVSPRSCSGNDTTWFWTATTWIANLAPGYYRHGCLLVYDAGARCNVQPTCTPAAPATCVVVDACLPRIPDDALAFTTPSWTNGSRMPTLTTFVVRWYGITVRHTFWLPVSRLDRCGWDGKPVQRYGPGYYLDTW